MPLEPQGTTYIGPFDASNIIVVDGYEVPFIEARHRDDVWELTLDHRFVIFVTGTEVDRWMWWVANAMAIAAGYSCHGENCTPINPHKRKVVGLSVDELKEINAEG